MVLLVKQIDRDYTFLPGGHVNFGESAADALKREIFEELGLDSNVGRFVGASEHHFINDGKPGHEINLLFEIHIHGLTPQNPPHSLETNLIFLFHDITRLEDIKFEPFSLRDKLHHWLKRDNGIICPWASTFDYASE
jgi:8-oxo-dGTP pyrophosphatase MutT (NUDIX family)